MTDSSSPFVNGKWLIIGMFGTAIGMGLFAWWHQREQSRRIVAVIGTEHAGRIRTAREVNLVAIDERGVVENLKSLKQVPGLIHVRHALVEDYSYHWDEERALRDLDWKFGIQFVGADNRATTLQFDPDNHVMRVLEVSDSSLWMTEAIDRIAEVVLQTEPAPAK